MNIKRIIAASLSILLLTASVPMAALAKEATASVAENRRLALLDEVWEALASVEAEAKAAGACMTETVLAVYRAAEQNGLVDKGSFTSVNGEGFSFTVGGMACCYDYALRSVKTEPCKETDPVTFIPGKNNRGINGPYNGNVLLVEPFYGIDTNYTDQYRNEAQSIAGVTGGSVTILEQDFATGPAIAAACTEAGIVILNSGGECSNSTAYIALHTDSGLTSADYSNKWAINGGSWYGIDGRYIQHHISGTLPNSFFWIASSYCMASDGAGTTGNALLASGAAAVYGYTNDVSYFGDYSYEAAFWNEMKNNEATVAEAFEVMTAKLGNTVPYNGSITAYPIIMSPVDPLPADPNSHQAVNCDWTLLVCGSGPVPLESFSLSAETVNVYTSFTQTIFFERVPYEANYFDLQWRSEDETVASITGGHRKAVITGVGEGTTRVYVDVIENGNTLGRAYCTVNVLRLPTLQEALNAEGGSLEFTTGDNYPWCVGILDGEPVAMAGNKGVSSSTSTVSLTLEMEAGDELSFKWRASSEKNYDMLSFFVNGAQYGSSISGDTGWLEAAYTAESAGTYVFEWRFSKDVSVGSYNDCAYLKEVLLDDSGSILMGDVDMDGTVTSVDALLALRASLDLITLNDDQFRRGDMDRSGSIDSADCVAILRKSFGLN